MRNSLNMLIIHYAIHYNTAASPWKHFVNKHLLTSIIIKLVLVTFLCLALFNKGSTLIQQCSAFKSVILAKAYCKVVFIGAKFQETINFHVNPY